MSTSACSTSRSRTPTPDALRRSRITDLRLRRSASSCGGIILPEPCGRSTRMTSAPRSASSIAANGPGPIPASSMTRAPARGPSALAPAARIAAASPPAGIRTSRFCGRPGKRSPYACRQMEHMPRRCERTGARYGPALKKGGRPWISAWLLSIGSWLRWRGA